MDEEDTSSKSKNALVDKKKDLDMIGMWILNIYQSIYQKKGIKPSKPYCNDVVIDLSAL